MIYQTIRLLLRPNTFCKNLNFMSKIVRAARFPTINISMLLNISTLKNVVIQTDVPFVVQYSLRLKTGI